MLFNKEPGYSTLSIDLSTSRDKERMPFAGGRLVILHTTGGSNKVTIQFNTDQADEIEAYRNFKYSGPFNVFYLSNEVQAGQTITIVIIGDPTLVDLEQLRMDLAGSVNVGATVDADEKTGVDTTGELLAAADADRLSLTLYVEGNDVKIGPSLAAAKFKVRAGGSVTIDHTSGAIYGKAAVGAADVYILVEKE